MNKEQWKSGGDCNKCRKQNYCSHECRAFRKRLEIEFNTFVAKHLADRVLRGSENDSEKKAQ